MGRGIDLLCQVAEECEVKLINRSLDCGCNVELVVLYADQYSQKFSLTIFQSNSDIRVRETFPDHLPSFCPERHINNNGTFCLGWSGAEDMSVYDETTARAWWARLFEFLRLQRRASNKRSWPGKSWAHGDAAKHQHNVEKNAEILGKRFSDGLAENRFKVDLVTIESAKRSAFRLYLDGILLYTVWSDSQKVANTRQPCVCDTGTHRKAMKSCRNHASVAANFAVSLWLMHFSEQEFWSSYRDSKCCRSMDNCQLAK